MPLLATQREPSPVWLHPTAPRHRRNLYHAARRPVSSGQGIAGPRKRPAAVCVGAATGVCRIHEGAVRCGGGAAGGAGVLLFSPVHPSPPLLVDRDLLVKIVWKMDLVGSL